jgi:hypothetical protein
MWHACQNHDTTNLLENMYNVSHTRQSFFLTHPLNNTIGQHTKAEAESLNRIKTFLLFICFLLLQKYTKMAERHTA